MPLAQEDIANAVHVDRATVLLPGLNGGTSGGFRGKAYALIILNQPIADLDMLARVWRNAAVVACADGGANRLYDALDDDLRTRYKPDFIAGDLDSLRPDVRSFYEHLTPAVPVYFSPDQYSTDFGKCLNVLRERDAEERYAIVALGGTGGRVDQGFHSIHTLFVHERAEEVRGLDGLTAEDAVAADARREITLLSDDSVSFLVGPGTCKIDTPRSVVGPTCGLIPVAGPAVISTHGLTWDVEDWGTRFGTQMSTSNALEGDVAYVKSDVTILFTIEVRR
ncbi:thiamine pyrophosphokinase [Limtongia smithiae]|uniref:thiamine pyrophosphokinase n=1 Tax=Limtongia smithiae TaxID=1125753 RepID=UPI0034CE9A7E